jgi:hypothetical protein
MRLYVAGPMRGYPAFNFPTFDAVAEALRAEGNSVANPAEHDRDVYPEIESWAGYATGDIAACPDFKFHDAMSWDLAQVAQSDGIVLLPGWEESSGARHERYVAEVCGKAILLAESGDLGWLTRWDPEQVRLTAAPKAAPDYTPGEVRVVNAETGGEKGSKLARYDLIPAEPLRLLAEHYGRGSLKYDDRNWERGYDWSLSFAALNRHLWQFWNGEDVDAETGSPHMAAVAWHAFTLLEFARTHPALDNRPSTRDEAA